jgi:hypothetical protein
LAARRRADRRGLIGRVYRGATTKPASRGSPSC